MIALKKSSVLYVREVLLSKKASLAWFNTIRAVSYTHLDVYKRQIDTRALTKILRNNGTMNGMITNEPIEDVDAALEKIRA